MSHRLWRTPLDLLLALDVGDDTNRLATRRVDLIDHRVNPILLAGQHRDFCPAPAKVQRGTLPMPEPAPVTNAHLARK
jgi:hypothetical protein